MFLNLENIAKLIRTVRL